MREVCSKLILKTPKQRQGRRYGVFVVNFEHISHLFPAFFCWFWACICLLGNLCSEGSLLQYFKCILDCSNFWNFELSNQKARGKYPGIYEIVSLTDLAFFALPSSWYREVAGYLETLANCFFAREKTSALLIFVKPFELQTIST